MSITVITGPPGAGKTTVARAIARSRPLGVHLEADVCSRWIVSGFISPWMPGTDRQNVAVTEAVGASAARYAAGGNQSPFEDRLVMIVRTESHLPVGSIVRSSPGSSSNPIRTTGRVRGSWPNPPSA
jgi:predicted ATPase